MKKALFIFLAFAISLPSVFSQNKREQKMQAAIDALMTTQFVQKYKEYKDIVEVTAGDFKPISTGYDAAEVGRIKFNYETSRAAFDKILDGVKKDLLDKSTREYIANSPDRYTQFVASELEMAMNNYQETVVYKINMLTGNQTVGFGIMEIKLLLDLVFDVVGVIQSINKELDRMSEEYLDQHFTSVLRIKSWDELGVAAMPATSATGGF
ncbi:MAG: hypothetical protein H6577_20735 [Lewinellaceae bacterium]|nr:hypothetical protein [Saprospiraceae bacterium]MCB9340558.1 hypothetical protein [Lewinellaceae bacterium]